MGAFGDLSRINTNVQSLQALASLQRTNSELGMRQLRLSTGSRINRAEDDSAGYSIAKKLEATVRGQAQALANIGDAKSMLTVAEGAVNTVMDILMTMKEKTVQAANDTMGEDERGAIKNQLDSLSSEIASILSDASFNGIKLFGAYDQDEEAWAATVLDFQVGAESGDVFTVTLNALHPEEISLEAADLLVSSAAEAGTTLENIDAAIKSVSSYLADIGDSQSRLTFKQDSLTTAMNNYEAARSRITDADFAREQMQIVKLQILQQTGTASLAQANAGPQAVLSLMG